MGKDKHSLQGAYSYYL